jgi:hypothetical protein
VVGIQHFQDEDLVVKPLDSAYDLEGWREVLVEWVRKFVKHISTMFKLRYNYEIEPYKYNSAHEFDKLQHYDIKGHC